MRLTTTPHGLRPGYLRPQGRQPRKPEAGGLPAGKWGTDQRLGGPSWQAAFMQKPSWPLAAADEGFRAEILESPYTHTETCLVQVSRIVGPLLPGAATDPFRTPVAAPWSGRWGWGVLHGVWELCNWGPLGPMPASATGRAPLDQGRCRGTHLLAEPQESNGVSLSPEAACAVHTAGPGRDKRRSG